MSQLIERETSTPTHKIKEISQLPLIFENVTGD